MTHPLDALLASALSDLTAAKAARADLERRARIPVDPDGYPTRASGAEPGSTTRASARLTVTRHLTVGASYEWHWTCTCGAHGGELRLHGLLTGGPLAGKVTGCSTEAQAWAEGTAHACLHDSLDYADPTGDHVANTRGPVSDPVSKRWRTYQRLAERLARDARALLDQTKEPTAIHDEAEREAFDATAWCANHRDHGHMEPADPRYAAKCRACYDFERVNAYPPSKTQIEYRHLHGRWKPILDRKPKATKLRRGA